MSEKLPNMLESTIQKIREMVDVNSVVGEPIHTPDGVTLIPVSKVSVGFGGGSSDLFGIKSDFDTASFDDLHGKLLFLCGWLRHS